MVADSKLSDMPGIHFLDEIMLRQPRAVRIVLSDLDDLPETANCIARVHRHLLKPCDAGTLAEALARALAESSWMPNQEARRLLAHLNWVPSPPRQYFEIAQEMASPTASLESIGELISADPPIAAKILQLANAAVLGLHLEVTRLAEAVAYLGFDVTRSLVLLAHTFAEFEKLVPGQFSAETLWFHSASVARIAKEIASSAGLPAEAEELSYSGGLLHDLGKIVLAANLPDVFSQATARARANNCQLHEAETELIGANHAEVGACLLGIWGLPPALVEAVGFHHNPSCAASTTFGPLGAIHVANALAHHEAGDVGASNPINVDRDYLVRLGVGDHLELWTAHCKAAGQSELQLGC